MRKKIVLRFLFIFFIGVLPYRSFSYALLSHEAIIDACWEKSIQPLLKERFPHSTAEQLKEAHAYVYGGSIVADIGYYPFGSSMFTHLLHYVRTGEFINNILEEADSLNEYAFAIGMLCHYLADSYGHPLGTNRVVPILFPKLQKKFGEVVTYEQGKTEHIRTEFSFDVLQTAKGNYKPEMYNDFIGFKINEPVLARAFEKTYSLKLEEVFGSMGAATASFRFTVKTMFPELTKDAWKIRHSFITELNPLADKTTYRYDMDKKKYKDQFGKPKVQSTVVAFIIGILPKVGPLKRLQVMDPNLESEKIYESSFKVIIKNYEADLRRLHSSKTLTLKNVDLDTGGDIAPGEYKITDESYYNYLMKLNKKHFEDVDEKLKDNIITFYTQPGRNKLSKRKEKKIDVAMASLKALPSSSVEHAVK